ncbi:hypothetical protein LCGC14_2351070 [marine sediment metagenome]|uniref:Uncharacterized protein n=1 Tax=marine sediment metagenome TaxID=412755 RepID=A0A0F9C9T0_9ZZZZ
MDEKNPEVEAMLAELQRYIERLNETLMSEIPKEVRETNKKYKDIIKIAGELDDYFSE